MTPLKMAENIEFLRDLRNSERTLSLRMYMPMSDRKGGHEGI